MHFFERGMYKFLTQTLNKLTKKKKKRNREEQFRYKIALKIILSNLKKAVVIQYLRDRNIFQVSCFFFF